MASFNKALIMGNLTRDPDLRSTPSGQSVCKFGVAINSKYKKGDDWVEDVTFVDVTTWGKLAETCGEYLHKGKAVFIDGRLQSSNWETEDGQKRSKMEVVAQTVQFLGSKDGEKKPDDSIPF